jgi:uncharacterized C2H2 Zn-finger protein
MPQLIVKTNDAGEIELLCPICDSVLETRSEQDRRVHIMLHPRAECRWSRDRFHVDRNTGYAELLPKEVEHGDPSPPESA